MKAQKNVTQLALYDIQHTKGVAADLSHINSPAKVLFTPAPSLGNWRSRCPRAS